MWVTDSFLGLLGEAEIGRGQGGQVMRGCDDLSAGPHQRPHCCSHPSSWLHGALAPHLLLLPSLPHAAPHLPSDILDSIMRAKGNKEKLGSALQQGSLGMK